jgi:fibronectin type 3 domain-containing protein
LEESDHHAEESVTVPFTLAEATEVRVVVYDVLGREVAVLADGAMEAGRYEVGWSEARSLPSGTYVVRLTAGALTQTRRMMLLR